MMRADDSLDQRDPQRPVRLLQAEHDALLPVLARTPEAAFDRPTACPDWSVRDVLSHCSAALTRAATGRLHAFTPELNEIDVAERRAWPLSRVLSELRSGYLAAGPVIRDAGGRLDALALGEWVHGGDVRDALGEALAYASAGIEDACALLVDPDPPAGGPAGRGQPAGRHAAARRGRARTAAGHLAHRPRHADAAVRRAAGRTG